MVSVSAGWISTKFALDLLVDPATREVSDVEHTIAAVASRTADKADQWVKDTWAEAKVDYKEGTVKTYGDYAQLYADKVSPQQPAESQGGRRLLTPERPVGHPWPSLGG